jgi:uroporphyrinogen-III synthase
MIPPLPLHKKQVLIPRGEKQAKYFSQLVEKLGGVPVAIPLIAFRPVAASEELASTLKQLDTYDWIIFTSNVTVETFFSFYKERHPFPKVAVIGSKTREALEHFGIQADFTPDEYVAEGFVREFAPFVMEGMRVLIPKGNLAREYISSSLRKQGAVVDELVIYETYMPEESGHTLAELLNRSSLDILAFTSPSTIDHFMESVHSYGLENKIGDSIVACIGPVSKRKAEQHGLCVHACPDKYTVEDMMESVIEYINRQEEQE